MNAQQEWDSFWQGITPESEIQMKDFYGGRPWILKHTPRFGRVVEAGCGLGRYVFYLSRLGVDIEGLDFHEPTVNYLLNWTREHGFACTFRTGDVLNLPYESDSMSGYLSFGVVEHFEEGPQKALAEAHRILRPGGVAIITTPSFNPLQAYFRVRRRAIDAARRLLGRSAPPRSFFQYWYAPARLAGFVNGSGLRVTLHGGGDLLYCLYELGRTPRGGLASRLLCGLENTFLAGLGAQSFTVSVKPGPRMHCFLCGEPRATAGTLERFYLPICEGCADSPLAAHYHHGARPRFSGAWQFHPPYLPPEDRICAYCRQDYRTSELFEDYALGTPVCETCMKKPEVSLELCNTALRPIWRLRGAVAG